jgi:hypothetical protein
MLQRTLKSGKLLNEKGILHQAGYATKLVKEYHRNEIKANHFRIKEWDYYYVGNSHYGVALTIADNSYMGLIGVTFLNFDEVWEKTKNVMTFMPKGRFNLPPTSKHGDLMFKNKKVDIQFFNDGKLRHLLCQMKDFTKGKDILVDIMLMEEPADSMVIATPFGKEKYEKHFYYNQKINCMRASGKVSYDDKEYDFKSEDSFAVLDWGRGVWPYRNTWYWSSMSGEVDGVKVGFNLGYGFGDLSNASENMIIYDGKAYKLEEVVFEIPSKNGKEEFMKPWKMETSDHKLKLRFDPILDRYSNSNILIIKSLTHQVFGKFSGTLKVGTKTIKINDMLGFAEKVINRW